MKILVVSSGNIVQLATYPRYFADQGHECVFINPEWSNALSNRTEEDEFGDYGNIRFYTWQDFEAKGINTERFDCIFGTQHGATTKVYKHMTAMNIPALLQILDMAFDSSLEKGSYSDYISILNKQKQLLELYPNIPNLTCINNALLGQLHRLSKKSYIDMVHYPVDTVLFDTVEDKEDEDFVLIVSRAARYKRIVLAIRACAYADKKLVIAGGVDDSLRDMAEETGAKVEFLGLVSDEQKADLMKRCKLHLFTQMWAEAPCIPPAEALYCKKPSIVFDYPAQREIEGGLSYYVKPGVWGLLGDKIIEIWDNYDIALEKAERGHEWVKNNLAPNVVSKQILNILERIVA